MLRAVLVSALVASGTCFIPISPVLRGALNPSTLPAQSHGVSLPVSSTGRPRVGRAASPLMLWNPFANKAEGGLDASKEEERAAARSTLLELCRSGPKNGVGASQELQESISNACSELARLNPTKQQAKSPLLNGDWSLLYTSTTGASAGKLGPLVGEVEQRIDMAAGKYDNVVVAGPIEAVLGAHWEVPADGKFDTWQVIFDDIKFKLFGLTVVDKEFSTESRDEVLDTLDSMATGKAQTNPKNAGVWEMTYTDETLRVLYAQGSDPAKPANVYILTK